MKNVLGGFTLAMLCLVGLEACQNGQDADPAITDGSGGPDEGPSDAGGHGGAGAGGGSGGRDARAPDTRPVDTRAADRAGGDPPPDSGTAADIKHGPGYCMTNADCPADQFCRTDNCYKTDQACLNHWNIYCTATGGVCIPRPVTCTTANFPTCGCNAETYINECAMQQAGASPASRDHSCEVVAKK